MEIPPKYEREMRRLRSKKKDIMLAAPLHYIEEGTEVTSFVLLLDGERSEVIRKKTEVSDTVSIEGDMEMSAPYGDCPTLMQSLLTMVSRLPAGQTTLN